jgi:hypothetical protein
MALANAYVLPTTRIPDIFGVASAASCDISSNWRELADRKNVRNVADTLEGVAGRSCQETTAWSRGTQTLAPQQSRTKASPEIFTAYKKNIAAPRGRLRRKTTDWRGFGGGRGAENGSQGACRGR